MGISRFGFTPIIPLMQRDLGISEWNIAVMASANYFGYFIGAYVSQKKWIIKYVRAWLGGGLVSSIILLIAVPFTLNNWIWTLLRLASGFFSAMLFVIASSITLTQGRSDWGGYLYSGVGIGIAFTGIFVPIFDSVGGWKSTWLGLAFGGSIFGAIAWHSLSKLSYSANEKLGQMQRENSLVRDYGWYVLLITYGLEGIGYIITATYIVQMIGTMPELRHIANQSWVFIGLSAIPSTYLWAQFAQKTSIQMSLILAYGLQALGILLPVIAPNQISILLGGALFGGTFMGITSLTIALAYQMKPALPLQAVGELTTSFALGQIVGPLVAACLQNNFDNVSPSLFAVLILILAVLVLISLVMKRKM